MAQQLGDSVMAATAPFLYALSTRVGCESHALQAITELDPNATVLSIDGIGAFLSDQSGFRCFNGCTMSRRLPFVRLFGSPSKYLWEDDSGTVHEIDQGEGGEQGHPMMPLLFFDVWVVCAPDKVSEVYSTLQTELLRHARIRVHDGKTQGWNRGWVPLLGCDILDRAARAVW